VFQDKTTYRTIMNDNFGPAMNWYRASIWGLNVEEEKVALASGKMDVKLHMPVLILSSSRDPLARITKAGDNIGKFAAELKTESLPTGHWVQLEEADKVNGILEEFVSGVEGGKKGMK